MRRRLSCAPGPTLSTAPGNTTPPIGHARAQRQPRPRAPTADSRSTRRHPPPGRRRRARIRPATAPIALHPADSVRIRFGFGRSEAVVSPLKSAPVPEAGAGRSSKKRMRRSSRSLTRAGIRASPAPIGATIWRAPTPHCVSQLSLIRTAYTSDAAYTEKPRGTFRSSGLLL